MFVFWRQNKTGRHLGNYRRDREQEENPQEFSYPEKSMVLHALPKCQKTSSSPSDSLKTQCKCSEDNSLPQGTCSLSLSADFLGGACRSGSHPRPEAGLGQGCDCVPGLRSEGAKDTCGQAATRRGPCWGQPQGCCGFPADQHGVNGIAPDGW